MSRDLIKKTHLKGKHLYYIRSGPYIKIGRTDNPELRLRQIKASNPFGASLIKVIKDAGELEHSLHQKYKNKHHTGEWFLLSDDEI